MAAPQDINTGLTADRLRELLDYDQKTGFFTWSHNGQRAGWVEPKTGYARITISGHRYLSHRLAWLHAHGRWPLDRLDHRNLNRADNHLSNLREATDLQNSANRPTSSNNKLAAKGCEQLSSGRFRARIWDGKNRSLGIFDTLSAAQAAYEDGAKKLFGNFARGG